MTCLLKAWVWCRRRPGWAFGIAASIVAVLLVMRSAILAWWVEKVQKSAIREVENGIEEQAERKKRQEADEGERRVDVIHVESSKERERIVSELEKNAENKDDPNKVADFLKEVGDEMRR